MKYYNEAGHFPANWGEKEIGYQGTSDSCPGSYFDGIQVKESFSPVVYTHENIQVEPDIQVRCFSYEDAGILVPRHWHNSLEILYIVAGDPGISMPPAGPSIPA